MRASRTLFAAILGLTVCGLAAAQPPGLYGVSHIQNDSLAKATVYYKWGANGAWKKTVIERGKKSYFSWAYDGAAKNSPDLYVRLDTDTDGVKFVEHTLTRGQSPDADSAKFGHHFALKQLAGTDTRYLQAVTTGAVVKVTDAKSSKPNIP